MVELQINDFLLCEKKNVLRLSEYQQHIKQLGSKEYYENAFLQERCKSNLFKKPHLMKRI